jgi:hypothetical protein
VDFLSFSRQMQDSILNKVKTASFHKLSNSLFTIQSFCVLSQPRPETPDVHLGNSVGAEGFPPGLKRVEREARHSLLSSTVREHWPLLPII